MRGHLIGCLPHRKQTKERSHVMRDPKGFNQRTICTLEKQETLFSFLSAPFPVVSESLWTDTPSEGHLCAWAGSQA